MQKTPLNRLHDAIGEAPSNVFGDDVATELMAVLRDFDRRLKALECPTCRRLDTACCEEHAGLDR